VLGQMFPVDAGKHHETLRRHALKVGEMLRDRIAIRPEAAASAIVVTLDSTFIAAVRTASGIWRCGSAMLKRRPVAARFSAPSPKPIPTSER